MPPKSTLQVLCAKGVDPGVAAKFNSLQSVHEFTVSVLGYADNNHVKNMRTFCDGRSHPDKYERMREFIESDHDFQATYSGTAFQILVFKKSTPNQQHATHRQKQHVLNAVLVLQDERAERGAYEPITINDLLGLFEGPTRDKQIDELFKACNAPDIEKFTQDVMQLMKLSPSKTESVAIFAERSRDALKRVITVFTLVISDIQESKSSVVFCVSDEVREFARPDVLANCISLAKLMEVLQLTGSGSCMWLRRFADGCCHGYFSRREMLRQWLLAPSLPEPRVALDFNIDYDVVKTPRRRYVAFHVNVFKSTGVLDFDFDTGLAPEVKAEAQKMTQHDLASIFGLEVLSPDSNLNSDFFSWKEASVAKLIDPDDNSTVEVKREGSKLVVRVAQKSSTKTPAHSSANDHCEAAADGTDGGNSGGGESGAGGGGGYGNDTDDSADDDDFETTNQDSPLSRAMSDVGPFVQTFESPVTTSTVGPLDLNTPK